MKIQAEHCSPGRTVTGDWRIFGKAQLTDRNHATHIQHKHDVKDMPRNNSAEVSYSAPEVTLPPTPLEPDLDCQRQVAVLDGDPLKVTGYKVAQYNLAPPASKGRLHLQILDTFLIWTLSANWAATTNICC